VGRISFKGQILSTAGLDTSGVPAHGAREAVAECFVTNRLVAIDPQNAPSKVSRQEAMALMWRMENTLAKLP
jgi:hypothetical protein